MLFDSDMESTRTRQNVGFHPIEGCRFAPYHADGMKFHVHVSLRAALCTLVALILVGPVVADCTSNSPRFSDATGPACPSTRQPVACGCTEPLEWDPVPATITGWEVQRRRSPSGPWVRVGIVPHERSVGVGHVCSGGFPDYGCVGNAPETIRGVESARVWTPVLDKVTLPAIEDVPLPGVLYDYRVRSMNLGDVGPWTPLIRYRAAPFICFDWIGGERGYPCI